MANTYYAQSDHRPRTMTVGDLVARLQQFDPADIVIFRSPEFGCFGSGTTYSIDKVDLEDLPASQRTFKGGSYVDDETGETITYEPRTDQWSAWRGVVIG